MTIDNLPPGAALAIQRAMLHGTRTPTLSPVATEIVEVCALCWELCRVMGKEPSVELLIDACDESAIDGAATIMQSVVDATLQGHPCG